MSYSHFGIGSALHYKTRMSESLAVRFGRTAQLLRGILRHDQLRNLALVLNLEDCHVHLGF
jgi:hypothetical protein